MDPLRYQSSDLKSYLIIGDNKGFIRVLDLRGIIKKYEFEKANNVEIKSSYNISKKDNINVEMQVTHFLQKDRETFGKYVNLYHNVIVREFQAHDQAITNLSKIKEPFSFITCAKDKKFKIWNFNCDLIGEINTHPSLYEMTQGITTEWKFDIDWEKHKEEEIEHLIRIYEELGGQPHKLDDENLLIGESQKVARKYSDTNLKIFEKKAAPKKDAMSNCRRFKALEIQKKETNEDSNEEFERFDVSYSTIIFNHRIKIL